MPTFPVGTECSTTAFSFSIFSGISVSGVRIRFVSLLWYTYKVYYEGPSIQKVTELVLNSH